MRAAARAAARARAPARPPLRPAVERRLPNRALQRRVGFEFEDASWRPWQLKHTGWWSRTTTVAPVPRQRVIDQGQGFELQADDTPGPKESNLEFVTRPFEETDAGLLEARVALDGIAAIYAQSLDPYVGRAGPDTRLQPPYPYTAASYVHQAQHGLHGGPSIAANDVALSGGRVGGRIKMQVTSGMALRDLPEVMKYIGSNVPGETHQQGLERTPGRSAIAANPGTSPIQTLVGNVPRLAQLVVARFKTRAEWVLTPEDGSPLDLEPLVGFAAALLLTIKALQQTDRTTGIKSRLPLMSRTSFVELINGLPLEHRQALQLLRDDFLDAVLAVSNATPLVPRSAQAYYDVDLTRASPLAPAPPPNFVGVAAPQQAVSWLTIGRWYDGLLAGTDYLLPRSWWRRSAKDVLESMGSVAALDAPQRAGGPRLGVFENRFIAPPAQGGVLGFAQAYEVAWNQLIFYKQLRDYRAGERASIGDYPTYAARDLP